jgi:hypothetical protein
MSDYGVALVLRQMSEEFADAGDFPRSARCLARAWVLEWRMRDQLVAEVEAWLSAASSTP